jgi:release factor glutamine methyltransferase
MTVGEWLNAARAQLQKASTGSPQLDSQLILSDSMNRSKEELAAHPESEIAPAALLQANQLLEQRCRRIPLSQVLGRRQFYGLDIKLTKDVLTPRMETEVMVQQAIELAPQNGRLLDLGTGSGAVAIAIAKHRPDLQVVGSDISPAALKIARGNAANHLVKIEVTLSDLFSKLSDRFDIICANLPYLKDSAELMPEVEKEPAIALFGGPNGLDLYCRFFEQVPRYIKRSGWIFIEADPWQHPELIKLGQARGLVSNFEDYFILGFTVTAEARLRRSP